MELHELKGVGKTRMEALHAVGIFSLRDLLFTLPVRYDDLSQIKTVAGSDIGFCCVRGIITDKPKFGHYRGISKVYAQITDKTGKLNLCWFNQPWMLKKLPLNRTVIIYGRITLSNGRKVMTNGKLIENNGIVPVYKPIPGIPAKIRGSIVLQTLDALVEHIIDPLPESFISRNGLMNLHEALTEIHRPTDRDRLFDALHRVYFERVLLYLTYVTLNHNTQQPGHTYRHAAESAGNFWDSLPFEPTLAQRRVLLELASDFESGHAMARLVQGDVGCGKTALAFGAIFLTWKNGLQSAMMAPTEILARQHFETAIKILYPMGMHCRLLTGSTKASERRIILNELREGVCNAVFGTHALISDTVSFYKLGLAVTDEQHRFGVRQRSVLSNKGLLSDDKTPHVLVMSATPIPRTLALILYGDLSLSVVDELPPGRIPVCTRIVPEHKRAAMYGFIRDQINAGNQAYIVCPLVDEAEESDSEVKSVKAQFDELRQNEFSGLRIGLTWGSQNYAEKEKVLNDFRDGVIKVLISTTVIEVGVNVPNATIMVVENASRFGLSQLHQLRGRVGRGNKESWCFLVSEETEKLRVLRETNDGFIVARKDMELRGPGDLLGHRQSGDASLGGMLCADTRLLDEVSGVVDRLFKDPDQTSEREIIRKLALEFAAENNFHMEKS